MRRNLKLAEVELESNSSKWIDFRPASGLKQWYCKDDELGILTNRGKGRDGPGR